MDGWATCRCYILPDNTRRELLRRATAPSEEPHDGLPCCDSISTSDDVDSDAHASTPGAIIDIRSQNTVSVPVCSRASCERSMREWQRQCWYEKAWRRRRRIH